VQYKDQYMYAPRTFFMEQLRTTASKGVYADSWNLYRVPGHLWKPGLSVGGYIGSDVAYLLSPVEFPEYAAGVASTKMQAWIPLGGDSKSNSGSGIVIPVGSMLVADLYHLTSRHGLANANPFNPASVMLTMCVPKGHPNAVEINGAVGQASFYVHHASWEVFGWVWSDPGEGGYWVPEPPLNFSVPACR